ncbi:MAG: hypothetical protein ACK5D5_10910, partial [Bacteroidota bacterium]
QHYSNKSRGKSVVKQQKKEGRFIILSTITGSYRTKEGTLLSDTKTILPLCINALRGMCVK